MILVVEDSNAQTHSDLLDQMFRLRARVFGERLKWPVRVTEGRERDDYDSAGPVYLIHTDDRARRVIGALRLLPTTGPTLLADFFADTLPDGALLSAPTIWECTRFCIDEDVVGSGRREQLLASGTLIAGLGEVALRSGIESVIGNFDAAMLRLYRRLGCEVEVLGTTRRYGNPVFLGLFPVSRQILQRVKARLGSDEGGIARALPAQAAA